MDRVWKKKRDEGMLQNPAFGGPDIFRAQPGSPLLVHTPQLSIGFTPTHSLPQLRPGEERRDRPALAVSPSFFCSLARRPFL